MGVLKAKVSGNWVPLEYNGGPNPQNALGVVAMGSFLSGISTLQSGTTTTLTNPINFTSIVGRRYRLCYQIRVIGVTTGNGIRLTWTGSGVDTAGTDTWQSVPTGPYSYMTGGVMFDGTGVASAYTMVAYVPGAATGVWLDPPTASYFYIEDVGPNSTPALPISATPPSRLSVFASATERTAAYPNPQPGDMCELSDTGWIWWYRSAAVGWVPLQATITSNSYSWGGWGTALAVSPPSSQENIGAYFFDTIPANYLYTTAAGTKLPGRYTLKVYFAASTSDPGYFSIMSNLGGNLNVGVSQMSWAIASSLASAVLPAGQAITFQFLKNISQVAWASSTITLSLNYTAV